MAPLARLAGARLAPVDDSCHIVLPPPGFTSHTLKGDAAPGLWLLRSRALSVSL